MIPVQRVMTRSDKHGHLCSSFISVAPRSYEYHVIMMNGTKSVLPSAISRIESFVSPYAVVGMNCESAWSLRFCPLNLQVGNKVTVGLCLG